MHVNPSLSCAFANIEGIGSYSNPVQALLTFCKSQLFISTNASPFLTKKTELHFLEPTCFYSFSAGPEVPRGTPGSSGHSKKWVRYGTELAAYIQENKLGEIATIGPRENKRYHPGCNCQVWLWHPDKDALFHWFTQITKSVSTSNEELPF